MSFRITQVIVLILIVSLNVFSPSIPQSLRHRSTFPPLVLHIHVRLGDEGYTFPDLVRAAQLQINSELANLDVTNWKVVLVDDLEASRDIDRVRNSLKPTQSKITSGKQQNPLEDDTQGLSNDVYSILLLRSSDDSVGVDAESYKAYLFYTAVAVYSNDLPFFITQAVIHHFMKSEILMFQNDNHQIKLPPNLTVNFAIPEQYDAIDQLDWSNAMETIFYPFSRIMSERGNIDIDLFKIQREWAASASNLTNNEFTYFCSQNVSLYPKYKYVGTNPELMKFIADSIYSVEGELGIPRDPDNNLRLKLQMVKRVMAARNLKKARDLLMGMISMGNIPDRKVLEEYEFLVGSGGLQPQPSQDEVGAWEKFYDASKNLLLQVEGEQGKDSGILKLYNKITWNYSDLTSSFLIGILLFTLFMG